MRSNANPTNEIKKLHVEQMVLFAINNIPEADSTTLQRFLELVNAGGTFGTISHRQIIKKMHVVLKYIPGACVHSLLILTDLLEIEVPGQPLLNAPQTNWLDSGQTNGGAMALFVEAPKAMTSKRNGVPAK